MHQMRDIYHKNKNHSSNKKCQKCFIKNSRLVYEEMTLAEFSEKFSNKGQYPSWRYSYLRSLNRKWNQEKISLPCFNCGYTKHVELAHIKAISSFSDSAKLKEVNASENVIQLCPNCHWEFDNNLIDFAAISP